MQNRALILWLWKAFKLTSLIKLLLVMMKPKCSPVRCTTLTLEQPVPESTKIQKHLQKGGLRCGAGQIPSEG